MKKLIVRFIVAVMLVSTLVTTLLTPMEAKAADSSYGEDHYNIMLVIDGSGSLEADKRRKKTDPTGMRFEMIGDLFGVLEDEGHSVAAIVFSGNESGDVSEKAMLSGIKLDTGFYSLGEKAPGNKDAKDYLTDQIEGVNVTSKNVSATDIGTAMLYAEEKLVEQCQKNGLPGLIFLFTDGRTDFPSVYGDSDSTKRHAISENNRNQACEDIYNNGIRVFGVFLNKDGAYKTDEVSDIVCAANGINVNSEEFAKSYVEIRTADDSHAAVSLFLDFLGFDRSPNPERHTDDFTEKFVIPGVGVKEMNIRLYSDGGANLPDLKVTIIQPDGTTLSGVPLRSSRTYRVYKLVDPMPGEWTIDVKVPKGNEVVFYYDPVMNVDVDATVEVVPAVADLHVNLDGQFTALLQQKGATLYDSASYRGYSCELKVTNLGNGTVETHSIQPNASSQFIQNVALNTYGTFEVQAVFTCEEIVIASPVVTLDLRNHNPQIVGKDKLNVLYGLFQPKETTVDLSTYFVDIEDGTNLTYAVKDTTCNSAAISLQGSTLMLTGKAIGDGIIVLLATDTQGGTTELPLDINSQSATMKYLLIILAILVVVALVAMLILWMRGRVKLDGDLMVDFKCEVNGRQEPITLKLGLYSGQIELGANLFDKIMATLGTDDSMRIRPGVQVGDAKATLNEYEKELKKVALSKTTKKRNRKAVAAVQVKYKRAKTVLLNDYVELEIKDNYWVKVEYQAPEEPDDDLDDVPKRKLFGKRRKKSTWDDEDLF